MAGGGGCAVRAGTLLDAWRVCWGRGGAGLEGADRPPRDLCIVSIGGNSGRQA